MMFVLKQTAPRDYAKMVALVALVLGWFVALVDAMAGCGFAQALTTACAIRLASSLVAFALIPVASAFLGAGLGWVYGKTTLLRQRESEFLA